MGVWKTRDKMERWRDEIPVYVGGERVKDKKEERGGGEG